MTGQHAGWLVEGRNYEKDKQCLSLSASLAPWLLHLSLFNLLTERRVLDDPEHWWSGTLSSNPMEVALDEESMQSWQQIVSHINNF